VRLSLDRAKIRAAQDHFHRGRRLQASASSTKPRRSCSCAEMNPGSGDIDELLREVRTTCAQDRRGA
jgi:hypothetical protein